VKFCSPPPAPGISRRAQGPGPTRHPRPRDCRPLGPFRRRHPDPLAGAIGATPDRSRARRRGAESQISRFSEFRGREGEIPLAHIKSYSSGPRTNPRSCHFVSVISGWVDDGSGSVRVRVHFGWTNPFSTLRFYNGPAQNGGQFRIIEIFKFRDRLG
jgi:hypothetical protein